jgi:hypothetical protein
VRWRYLENDFEALVKDGEPGHARQEVIADLWSGVWDGRGGGVVQTHVRAQSNQTTITTLTSALPSLGEWPTRGSTQLQRNVKRCGRRG